jgi:hypothetical protein
VATLWGELGGAKAIRPYSSEVWRVVEGQHVNSTRKLVDSLAEHELLERLLDEKKPSMPAECTNLHYLLSTPFRYPPLKYGSRFGTRRERSLWYGAEEVSTALAETAFYRLWFLRDTAAKLAPLESEFTAFNVRVETARAVDLTVEPFSRKRAEISNKTKFAVPQQLGADMRAANVEAFRYFSARQERGINVGVLSCKAFAGSPIREQHWHCFASTDSVEFFSTMQRERHEFARTQYLVDGDLAPRPS